MQKGELLKRIKDVIRSQRGRNILVFGIFLVISAILWSVLTLNEEEQYDLRMPVVLTNVPDTVTVIGTPPEYVSVSLRTKGTTIVKQTLGRVPELKIDFRVYRSRKGIILGDADLKALARSPFGGANILVVSPDSINLPYTTRPGQPYPVVVDYKATAGPRTVLTGRPKVSVDSVKVFSNRRLPDNLTAIATEPIRLTGLEHTTTTRVRLVAPRNSRVIPDSVDVTIDVEPLIAKTRSVPIETVNVPKDVRVITFPHEIEVNYMVPMSIYNNTHPDFRVLADYNSISRTSHKIRLRLRDVPDNLTNVRLSLDSVEYIIERL